MVVSSSASTLSEVIIHTNFYVSLSASTLREVIIHTNFYVSSSASTLGEVYREQVKKIKASRYNLLIIRKSLEVTIDVQCVILLDTMLHSSASLEVTVYNKIHQSHCLEGYSPTGITLWCL